MSINTRVRTKTQRMVFEGSHQLYTEHLWQSFKEVIDQDIFKRLYTLVSEEEQSQYLEDIESCFIQKALNYKVPKYIVLNSNAWNCIRRLTRKRDLAPSNFRRTLTQLETCAQKKVKHARFI